MCGIFGQYSRGRRLYPNDVLQRSLKSLAHRGPDAEGSWNNGTFFLGHRRLSIIDLKNGAQPMHAPGDRGVISYNGEIYNHVELRKKLAREGYPFHTTSDTEVILAAYDHWGVEMPTHLEGMFAIAIADPKNETLFLARDRFGEKPLFIRENSDGVVFSSELKGLASLPDLDRELDFKALSQYLCLNYVPGNQTLFSQVRRLPQASWKLYGPRGEKTRQYWSPRSETSDAGPMADAVIQFRRTFDQAVAITLRSDVPVGLFLSGGIDSSLVAESAVRQGSLKKAFCLDFDEENFSEWDKSSFVATKLGLQLERVKLDHSVLDHFLDLSAHWDDPLADSSALAVARISERAAQDLKVVVTGDGGDELFGGYLTYRATDLHRRYIARMPLGFRKFLARASQWLPQTGKKVSFEYKLARFLRASHLDTREAHFTWNGAWMPETAQELLAQDYFAEPLLEKALKNELELSPTLLDLQRADLADYLPNDILVKTDRMTMAFGLESRTPFLNSHVADFALSLPDSFKVSRTGETKFLLRQVSEQIFGPQISRAKKQGFSIPIHRWLRGPGRALVEDLLSKKSLEGLPYLKAESVTRYKELHLAGRKQLGYELWGLMVLVAWNRNWRTANESIRSCPAATGS